MPFVDGESLRARLLRERELPVAEAARVLRDVASALAYAHARGVVHRDIKPDNVLLSHGTAVVTDFGVAKALTASTGYSGAPTGPGLTSMGVTLGTPHYMAPEQGAGDPAMDHRVDLYAFGATAYEILTGEPPFTGNSPHAILGAHIVALPRPITSVRPGLPPLLGHIVMQCLEKRPADRPQSADEIIRGLDSLTTPTGGTVPLRVTNGPHATRPGQGRAWLRRIMVPLALVGIVVAAGAGRLAAARCSATRAAGPGGEARVRGRGTGPRADAARSPCNARHLPCRDDRGAGAPAASARGRAQPAERPGCRAARKAALDGGGRARPGRGCRRGRVDPGSGRLQPRAGRAAGRPPAHRGGRRRALGREHALVRRRDAASSQRAARPAAGDRAASGGASAAARADSGPRATARSRRADPPPLRRIRLGDRVPQRGCDPAGLPRALARPVAGVGRLLPRRPRRRCRAEGDGARR